MPKALFLSLAILAGSTAIASQDNAFHFLDIEVEEGNILTWKTIHEDEDLNYYVEQFVYNEWQVVTEVSPLGEDDTCFYAVSIDAQLHSGTNKFRIAREAVNYIAAYSDEVSYVSDLPTIFHFEKRHKVTLSKRVSYFVVNESGLRIKEGYGSVIDLSDYEKGIYLLCFDNQVAEIRR